MGKTVVMKWLFLLVSVFLWSPKGHTTPSCIFVKDVLFDSTVNDGKEFANSEADTLTGLPSNEQRLAPAMGSVKNGSVGLLTGAVQSGSNFGIGESDFIFGVYHRQLFGDYFFGEARTSIGIFSDERQKARVIPVEYRIHYRLSRLARDGHGGNRFHSPYFYLGVGILYHKPLEITPPLDPRFGRLDGGRLPSSSLFDFNDGFTPFIPVGIGLDIRLDPAVNLNLQVGYHRILNELTIRGDGFQSHYMGFTIGLNFRRSAPSGPERRKEQILPPIVESPPTEPEPVTVGEVSPQEHADKPLPLEAETVDAEPIANAFPPGMRVDTVEEVCRYSVQVGSFQSLQRAIQVLEEATTKTGDSFDIWYNRQNGYYMVRARPEKSHLDAVRKAESVERTAGNFDVAIVQQCGLDRIETEPMPLQFQVQIAAFQGKERAVRYAGELRENRGIDIVVQQSDDSAFYRVRTKPYETIFEARQALRLLESMGLGEDLFLTSAPETTRFEPDFDYILQAGVFMTVEEAAERARKIQSETVYPLRVLVDEQENLILLFDFPEADWIRLKSVKMEIIDLGIGPAVLYMIEKFMSP